MNKAEVIRQRIKTFTLSSGEMIMGYVKFRPGEEAPDGNKSTDYIVERPFRINIYTPSPEDFDEFGHPESDPAMSFFSLEAYNPFSETTLNYVFAGFGVIALSETNDRGKDLYMSAVTMQIQKENEEALERVRVQAREVTAAYEEAGELDDAVLNNVTNLKDWIVDDDTSKN